MTHGAYSAWLTWILSPILLMGALTGPANAIDLETAVWYYERNQWVPAFFDFQILAAEGDPTAAAYMGRMYRQGWGVQKNLEEAAKWLQTGADGGVPFAHHRLGWMYARGEVGGKRDNVNAVKHWKLAAEKGEPSAQLDLGVMYWRGDGILKDLVLAYTWMSIASGNEVPAANQNLENLTVEMSADQIVQPKSLIELLSAEINSKS